MSELPRTPEAVELNISELRELTAWSCDCAERSLRIIQRALPGDDRCVSAIAAARAFAEGGSRGKHLRKSAMDAFRAKSEVEDPAGSAAAEAASHAAASAFLHPIFKAHQVLHILGAAACSSWALAEAGEASLDEALREAMSWATPKLLSVRHRYPALKAPKTRFKESYEKLDALFLA